MGVVGGRTVVVDESSGTNCVVGCGGTAVVGAAGSVPVKTVVSEVAPGVVDVGATVVVVLSTQAMMPTVTYRVHRTTESGSKIFLMACRRAFVLNCTLPCASKASTERSVTEYVLILHSYCHSVR